jgi:prepilin-type N-terminal cleavage/methylation domain-containing protein
MTPLSRTRRGFSLTEMLCVISLLTIVLGVLAILLKECLDLERAQAENFERMAQHQALADEFRGDVARAEKAPEAWQDYKAGPGTLILQLKEGHHVVYQWKDGQLERRAIEGREEPARGIAIDKEKVDVEFVRDGSGSGLVKLRLFTLRDGKRSSEETLEIAAALGGDWR